MRTDRSTSVPATDSLVGSTILHYRVLEELGRGGRGRVYLAEDRRLERHVALKVLDAPALRETGILAELEREAHTLAAVSHPNIATIYSLESEGDLHFITMELVRGETLACRLQSGALSPDRAYDVARQIASAMEAAHVSGVVHDDLKPGNIHVTPDGRVKVLDFGLAQMFRPGAPPTDDSTVRTRDLGFAGTPGYMSPEQLRGQATGASTDVWALGCVLWECLTGRPAFGGATFPDRVAATLEREPDWASLPSEVSDRIRTLLARCLAKDPGGRPASMADVRTEIEEEITDRRLGRETSRARGPAGKAVPSVPRPLDSFVGRAREIAHLESVLREASIVTLTGPAGCGKTRLAIEVAHRAAGAFPDGVWFVEFAPTRDPDLVWTAVASTLGITEEPQQSLSVTVRSGLRDRRALLVLDNCEHVLEASARLIEDLCRSNPRLRVLATSREALHVPGERAFAVPSLGLPGGDVGDPLALRDVEAVRLLVDRIRAADPTFDVTRENAAVLAKICARLDGIPLALELAAARVRSLSLSEIAERLDECFCLLTGGAATSLPKQQTLRASIDWSYELLTEEERRLFRALSVFAGGWTLDAAERVGATEGAADWRILDRHCHLVEKSLVERVTEASGPGERSRYRMLEIMRQYAAARLCERGEEKAVRARHLAHFLSLAEAAEPHLRDAAQTEWIGRLDRERDNLQVAFQTADHDDDPELGLRLAGALGRYWLVRGRWDEGRGYCRRVLDRTQEHPGSVAQGRTLNASGNLAFHQGHYEQARRDHLAALAIRRAIGDATGEANSLNNLGEIARIQGDHDLARSSYEAAREIQERVQDQWGLAVSLNNLGEIAQVQGDLDTAEDLHGRALGLWAEIRDRWGAAWSLGNLGYVATQRGDLEEARSYYARSLAKSREIRDEFGIALCQHALGDVAARQGDPDRALAHHTESLALRRRLGDRKGIAESLEALALLPGGSPKLAVRILGAAEAIRETIHAPVPESRRTDLRALAERLRAELGDAKFRSTWEAGRDLAADEAAALALARNETSATRR